jgi:hypothetical protein
MLRCSIVTRTRLRKRRSAHFVAPLTTEVPQLTQGGGAE